MNMKPPLQRTANQLSDYGRFGDSTLVHMNPAEVRGLASMSPTGELTINPVTGQPEAFLPFLAPLLGSWLGGAALGGTALGMTGASALGAGLATWAESGSFEKGLISGVTGFGLGQLFKGGADAANLAPELAAVDAAQQGVTGAMQGVSYSPELAQVGEYLQGVNPMANAQTLGAGMAGPPVRAPGIFPGDISGGMTAGSPISAAQQGFLDASQNLSTAQGGLNVGRGSLTPGQRAGSLFSREGLAGMGQQLKNPAATMPMVLGAGTRANVEQQEYMEGVRKGGLRDQAAKNRRFEGILHNAREMASRTRGTNPYQNPFKSAAGGIVGYNGGGEIGSGDPAAWSATSLGRFGANPTKNTYIDPETGEYFIDTVAGSGAEQQSFLRGKFEQQAPTDYRHGFEKEFDFFTQVDDPELDRSLDLFGSGASDRLAGLAGLTPAQLQAYYDAVRDAEGRPLSSYGDTTSIFSGVTGGIDNTAAGVTETTAGDTLITAGTAADTTDIFSGEDPLTETTITCYNQESGQSQSVTGVNPSCPTGWATTAPDSGTETTITCYNDQTGDSQSVTGVNPTCPVGWSTTDPTTGGTETTITCYNATGDSQSVTGVNPSCPVDWSETDPTAGGTETTITCYNQETGESQSVTGVNPSCSTGWSTTEPVPEWLRTLQEISPEVDDDYSQTEIDAIVSLIDSGADTQQIADYYGMTVDELMGYYNYIKTAGSLQGTTPGDQIDDDYSQTEINSIVSLIDSGADTQQIADYYNMTVDELMGYYNTIKATAGSLQATTPRDQIDDDYSQTEIDEIVSLIDSGASRQQIADYYNMSLDELMGYYNAIKAGDTTTDDGTTVVDDTPEWESALNAITAAVDVDGDYSEAEADAVYDLYARGGATAEQIAEYYGMTVDEFKAYADDISSQRGITATLSEITPASEVDGDYSEAEADEVWNLYMDGGATAQQIADYYNMSVEDFLAYADEISAAKAGDTYNRAIDTSTIAGAGTLPTVTEGQVDTIIGDTTAANAGVIPETGAWDTSYIADDAGTLEAAYATAEQQNREAQAQNIRDYVTTNYGDGPAGAVATDDTVVADDDIAPDRSELIRDYVTETFGDPPYTQEQAIEFSKVAIENNVPAQEVADALNIDVGTVQSFYNQAVGFNIAGSIGDDIELGEIGVAGGGRVGTRRFMTSLGPVELANGGIADLPVNPEFMQPMEEVLEEEFIVEEEPYVDYPQLIEMTVEAIKGNVEDADAVINQFIEEYGIEKFQMLRDAVLKLVAGNPEAQTEGMIVGTGGGMDDEVMGVIGEQQDIAVSPDEYIVAADVVSGLGDGSSQAGADILDQVAANVRAARSGGRQPAPINLSKVMSV